MNVRIEKGGEVIEQAVYRVHLIKHSNKQADTRTEVYAYLHKHTHVHNYLYVQVYR